MDKVIVGISIILVSLSAGFLVAGLTQHHLWKEMAIILGFAAGSIGLGGTLALIGFMVASSLNLRLSHATTK